MEKTCFEDNCPYRVIPRPPGHRCEVCMPLTHASGGTNISKEWCINAAKAEGDAEIGAGRLAADPTFDESN